jgi:hypothetical protein
VSAVIGFGFADLGQRLSGLLAELLERGHAGAIAIDSARQDAEKLTPAGT